MNHHLPKHEYQVTFVRTVYSTVTILAESATEAENLAESWTRDRKMSDEIDANEDENRQDWKIDSVSRGTMFYFKEPK